MKLSIQTYKYVKELVKEHIITLPDEPFYFFQFGRRISWAIVPLWVDEWKDGRKTGVRKIYRYNITGISNSFGVELYYFHWTVSSGDDIERLYNSEGKQKSIQRELLELLSNGRVDKRMIRNYERWKSDLDSFYEKISEHSIQDEYLSKDFYWEEE